MESSEHAEEWKRIAGSTQVLLRSRIEINAILQSIVDEGLPLLSHHQVRDRMFVARLHRVCDEEGFIVAAREIEAMQKVFVLDLERADEDGG